MRVRDALLATFVLAAAASVHAHDLERTQVTLTFGTDGSFVLDVANDANWLRLRLEDFARDYAALAPTPDVALSDAQRDARLGALASTFSDRVVMWVDHAEVRPTSAEYLPPRDRGSSDPPIGTFRMRGRVPIGAHTLQWFYGIVIDPYPLTIHRADKGRTSEAVLSSAWSQPIDLTGQFHPPTLAERMRVTALRGTGWKVVSMVAVAMMVWIAAAGIARTRRRTGPG
jgi:hypothetical protein